MDKFDSIPKPRHYWHEDEAGNTTSPDSLVLCNPPSDQEYQHSKELIVAYNIRHDNKALYKGSTSISDSSFPLIKYLVDIKGWRFFHACILITELCSRCQCILENEAGISNCSRIHGGGYCEYCEMLDPPFAQLYKIRAVYRAWFHHRDIKEAYKEYNSKRAR
jgi:hypothetical protein